MFSSEEKTFGEKLFKKRFFLLNKPFFRQIFNKTLDFTEQTILQNEINEKLPKFVTTKKYFFSKILTNGLFTNIKQMIEKSKALLSMSH